MSETQKPVKAKKKKAQAKPKSRIYGVIVMSMSFALACLVSITSLTPKRYDVSVGSRAAEAISTPRMIVDEVNTEALRQAARNKIAPVYAVDEKLADSLISNAESFFSALASFKNAANTTRAASLTATGGDKDADDTRSWQDVIPTADLTAMLDKLPVKVTDPALGCALLEASDAEIKQLKELVTTTLQTELRAGVTEADQVKTLSRINKALKVTSLSVWLKAVGELVYDVRTSTFSVLAWPASSAERCGVTTSCSAVMIFLLFGSGGRRGRRRWRGRCRQRRPATGCAAAHCRRAASTSR